MQVYVKNSVPFVGDVLNEYDTYLEVKVDFDHDLTSKSLTKRVNVYRVPREWCFNLEGLPYDSIVERM